MARHSAAHSKKKSSSKKMKAKGMRKAHKRSPSEEREKVPGRAAKDIFDRVMSHVGVKMAHHKSTM
jgi:hypothetical protein